jgi:hypothetical protein
LYAVGIFQCGVQLSIAAKEMSSNRCVIHDWGEVLNVGILLIMVFSCQPQSMTTLLSIQHQTAPVIRDPLQLNESSSYLQWLQ